MRFFLKALVLVPIALAIVLFSVANRAPVRISLDPISLTPIFAFDAPLFAVVLAAIAAGVLIGGLAAAAAFAIAISVAPGNSGPARIRRTLTASWFSSAMASRRSPGADASRRRKFCRRTNCRTRSIPSC